MAKALRERVEKQYKGTQRTRKAVHGECTVELAKWTFLVISLCREPYEAKVSRTGLTGGMGRRTVRQRALCLPSKQIRGNIVYIPLTKTPLACLGREEPYGPLIHKDMLPGPARRS